MTLKNDHETRILNGHADIRERRYRYSLSYSSSSRDLGTCRVQSLRIKPVFRDGDGTQSGVAFMDFYREVTTLLGKIERDLHVELENRATRESMQMNSEIFQQFPAFDERLARLKSIHQSGTLSSLDEPMASMTATKAQKMESDLREHRDVTMVTVADLYRRALLNFPKRDRGVVEYIQEHMPWLSKNEVTYFIQRARKTGIDLPIYRRGRVPKAKSSPTSQDD